MSPETLVIDRTFRGVGRIKKATGTTNPAVKRRIVAMLVALADEGRLDYLRAIRDGQLSLRQVYEAYTAKGLDKLPIGATAQNLVVAMTAWIDGLRVPDEVSAKHHRSLQMSCTYIQRRHGKAMVGEIPAVVRSLRDSLGREHPRTFNLLRSAALAFVRQTFSRAHPLWLEVAAVEIRKVKARTKRTPLSVVQMQGFFPAPASDPIDAIAWSLATTGMRPKEYFGAWHVLPDRVHVIGTKTHNAVRDVPLVWRPVVPAIARVTFEKGLRKRTRAITAYDLRRTFANWMEAAGIPRTRRRLYLGHGAGDVTGLYELHEVAAYLTADATTLKRHLGIVTTNSSTMTLEKQSGT
ncbi:MAG: hypothetical protein ACYC3F_16815 [Gemmatimonadaceae bacterium]